MSFLFTSQGERETERETEMEEELSGGVAWFLVLPDGCISDILSLTSPGDTCRASAISWGFKSAAESDAVWERFLPSDYREIISRSVSPVVYSTKKELYFRLCNSPILLDGGTMSFQLNKCSGKKSFMLRARELSIAWGDTPAYWKWTSLPDSRFSEVAELCAVCWLDIRGKMGTRMLSPNTAYAAYLVFKFAENAHGLECPAKASVRFVGESGDDGAAENETSTVYLKTPPSRYVPRRWTYRHVSAPNGVLSKTRLDGWMEIELGEFFNDHGDDGEVEMRLMEIRLLNWKCGLIVEGIELRPKGES